MRSILLSILLLVLFQSIYSQDSIVRSDNLFSPTLNIHIGKLIKIHGTYPQNKISSVTELGFNWESYGKKAWQSAWRYPDFGFSLTHAQFGNVDTLGNSFGIIPYLNFSPKEKEGFSVFFKTGIGIAYFDNPYHPSENAGNYVIGSKITAIVTFQLGLRKKIGKKMSINGGLSAWHYSNSHVRVPNIGANIVSGNIGLKYRFKNQAKDFTPIRNVFDKKAFRKTKTRPTFTARIGLGMHAIPGTIEPRSGPLYPVYDGSIYASWRARRTSFWNAGIHINYYPGFYAFSVNNELFEASELDRKKAMMVVAFVGQEWVLGKLGFILQVGANIYNPFYQEYSKYRNLQRLKPMNLYTSAKLGFRYYPLRKSIGDSYKSPFLGCAVKTIGGTAEFFEMSLGFGF